MAAIPQIIGGIKGIFSEKKVFGPNRNDDPKIMVFPRELRDLNKEHPSMSININEGGELRYVWLPMPVGLRFSDSARISDLELGMGANVEKEIQQITTGDFKGAISGLKAKITSGISSTSGMEIAAIASMLNGRTQGLGDKYLFANRKILNSNTVSNFSGNDVRTFSFSYTLVPRDESEANELRNIDSFLRRNIYAKKGPGVDLVLEFPPVWVVKFWNKPGEENKFIPRIWSCYCSSYESTINDSTNLFREDGSPITVSISINLTETRVLNREDIELLENGGEKLDRGVDPVTGLAKSTNFSYTPDDAIASGEVAKERRMTALQERDPEIYKVAVDKALNISKPE